jgi:hypothetical protein
MLPQDVPEQPAAETAQATPLFALSFVTVAVKLACCPTATDAVAGETETEMGCGAGGIGKLTVPTEPPPQPTSKNAIVTKLSIPSRQNESEGRSKVILPLKEESAGGRRGIVHFKTMCRVAVELGVDGTTDRVRARAHNSVTGNAARTCFGVD